MLGELIIKDDKIYIIRNDRNPEVVGILKDSVYKCKKNAEKHLNFIHNGWGIDKKIVNDLEGLGIKYIHVFDEYFSEDFYCQLEVIKELGIVEEYNYGQQLILSKKKL